MKYPALSLIALLAATAIVACSSTDSTSTPSAGGTSSATGGGSSTGGSGSTTTAPAAGKGNTGACKSEKDVTASATATAACEAFCVIEDPCDPETTVAACKEYRQCPIQDTGPTGCAEASKKYWDCMRAQGDVCTMESCCDAQAAAMQTVCSA